MHSTYHKYSKFGDKIVIHKCIDSVLQNKSLLYFISSNTTLLNPAYTVAGAHALSCGLTKVFANTTIGALPFSQVQNRKNKIQLMYFLLLLWLFYDILLYYFFITIPRSVNHGWVLKQVDFNQLRGYVLPKAPLTPIDLRYSRFTP